MLRSVPGLDWSVVREQHLPLFLDNAGEVLSFDTFWKKVLASGAKHKGIPTKSTSDADKKRWAAWCVSCQILLDCSLTTQVASASC